jgi:intraflagellar transport protein 80
VEYIQYIKAIPSEEGKQAELALYRRHPDEAERILLQASPPLVYRAIKLNLNLFRWTRALDLAIKHKSHMETVLAYRQKYLQSFEREEVNQKFMQYFKQVWPYLKYTLYYNLDANINLSSYIKSSFETR